jgi:hypothetical protein
MRYYGFAVLLALCTVPCFGQGGMLHDKSGACQLAIPAAWSVDKTNTWIGSAPANAGSVQLVSQPGKTVRPLTAGDQKALMVGKLISNTSQSVFYANEPPKNANPLTSYRAVAPGKGGTCVALFSVRSTISVDTLKEMVATLAPAQ